MDVLISFKEFVSDIKIKNKSHEKIVRQFYPYFRCVCGKPEALSKIIGEIIGVDFSNTYMRTGCLNGIFDGTEPPFENVDLYIKFDNDIRVFVYGSIHQIEKELMNNEYVLYMISNELDGKIERKPNRYIYVYPSV